MYQRQVLNYGQPKAAVIPRCWPVTNAHTHTHTHIYPRRGINPRDGRCFRGIISFGSGSWLTWTTVHSGRRLSAFRFPLFPPSLPLHKPPAPPFFSILRLIFCQDFSPLLLVLRSENEFIWPLSVNGEDIPFFFFFFFFFR